ncbi:hypothetical protein Hte_001310 [Hypoxylon texense]
MFEKLLKACRDLEEARTPWSQKASDDLMHLVPDTITSQDVKEFLSENDKRELGSVAALWASHAAILRIARNVQDEKDDTKDNLNSTLIEIADRISSIILPVCDGASLDDDTTDYAALQRKADLGLVALDHLTKLLPGGPSQLSASTHLRLTAFTDPADAWTSPASARLSRTLLQPLDAPERREQRTRLVAEDILTGFLRPLFSKSRPAAVTASGRKAEFVEPSRYDSAASDSPETKPWKYARRYAVAVFAWAVFHADSELLQKHWPLYTPVLLTLLDESQPAALKVRALGLLRAFWARCPAGLMRQTGLADVFEQAAFPAVLYLPTLTPEDESLAILGAAYPALIEMAGLVADDHSDAGASLQPREGGKQEQQQQQLTEAHRMLLDKIIREGILVGYHHAKQHIRIDFIPMASEILTDPFGTQHMPSLMSAVKLLQAILRTCWPRIPHCCNEIIKMLMLCWLNVADDDDDEDSLPSGSPTLSKLKPELTKTADMLFAIMKAAEVDVSERVDPLIEKEPQLEKLFRARNLG